MTSDDERSATPSRGAVTPGQAEVLRRIALHQETAALLEQRARRAASAAASEPLRRRAAEHAREAQRLRAELAAQRSTSRRSPQRQEAPAGE